MDAAKIAALAERVRQVQGQSLNEAMTKNSLIMPFINALGYDVFNPSEVAAEYTADFGTKRGEKIDFALLKEGNPVILIECKPLGAPLDTGKCSQLFRYFSTQPARIGILTDGCRYLFFSDIDQLNIMDTKPFMEINLLDFNERYLPEIQKLAKESFDEDGIVSAAGNLKMARAVYLLFSDDMSNPSDEFIRLYASQCYDGGKITSTIREQFKPIIKRAVSEYINDQINKRLESAKTVEEKIERETSSQQIQEQEDDNNGIITTDEEFASLYVIQAIVRGVIEPRRVYLRDAKTYCSIIIDNNNRKPLCRLFYDVKNPYVIIYDEQAEEKAYVKEVEDLYNYAQRFVNAAQKFAE